MPKYHKSLDELRKELSEIVDSIETKPKVKRKRLSIPESAFDSPTKPKFIFCRDSDYKKI
ncbi:hypothetical protein M0R19_05470 [Candidatus Pacearchaeota archaeon]|jgi:hypothetical protein|nr:hypothetical protein [Candidatus Pacearchaeota archaeon]